MPVLRNKFAIYTLSGFMAGLAGWVFVSRVSTTRQDMGTGWELTAITAVAGVAAWTVAKRLTRAR